jgi:hypothetical protein
MNKLRSAKALLALALAVGALGGGHQALATHDAQSTVAGAGWKNLQ